MHVARYQNIVVVENYAIEVEKQLSSHFLIHKVVHLLNTKNDEHEAFVQKLRFLHEAELQRVLTDSASRLQRWQEEATRESEAGKRKAEEVREVLREVVKERDQLLETQVCCCSQNVILCLCVRLLMFRAD